ncbi:hypothetical protein CR513_51662, partial [Mucuna pruriens]
MKNELLHLGWRRGYGVGQSGRGRERKGERKEENSNGEAKLKEQNKKIGDLSCGIGSWEAVCSLFLMMDLPICVHMLIVPRKG